MKRCLAYIWKAFVWFSETAVVVTLLLIAAFLTGYGLPLFFMEGVAYGLAFVVFMTMVWVVLVDAVWESYFR